MTTQKYLDRKRLLKFLGDRFVDNKEKLHWYLIVVFYSLFVLFAIFTEFYTH